MRLWEYSIQTITTGGIATGKRTLWPTETKTTTERENPLSLLLTATVPMIPTVRVTMKAIARDVKSVNKEPVRRRLKFQSLSFSPQGC